jgi:LacI family transcriptional regulator
MVTVKDVANKAGVSIATVSRVLNETRFVSDELHQRVMEAVDELNYRPNAIARSLRCRRTHNIAMVVPDIAYPLLAEVARGVQERSYRLGYSAIMCVSDGNPEREADCLQTLMEKQVDGIILVAAGSKSWHVQALVAAGLPLVICNRALPGVRADTVVADDEASGWLAVTHLLDLGHEEVGCIAGPESLSVSQDRVNGYRRAMQSRGTPCRPDLLVHGDFRYRGGYEAMHRLLDLTTPPNAIFACNDMMAMGAICAASQRRRRIPEDVAIVGCDDIAMARFTNPSLTTVAQPKHQMGSMAVDMLTEKMELGESPDTQRVLPVELVIRDSS